MATLIERRVEAVARAIERVKNHPMCGRFIDDGSTYTVLYPPGDFRTDGVRCSYGMVNSKSEALGRLLSVMEEEWSSSYPATRPFS